MPRAAGRTYEKAPVGQGLAADRGDHPLRDRMRQPLAALVRTLPFRPLGKKPPPVTAALLR